MNEWMFNDTPAQKTDRPLGVREPAMMLTNVLLFDTMLNNEHYLFLVPLDHRLSPSSCGVGVLKDHPLDLVGPSWGILVQAFSSSPVVHPSYSHPTVHLQVQTDQDL